MSRKGIVTERTRKKRMGKAIMALKVFGAAFMMIGVTELCLLITAIDFTIDYPDLLLVGLVQAVALIVLGAKLMELKLTREMRRLNRYSKIFAISERITKSFEKNAG